jgi:hypothetical protein
VRPIFDKYLDSKKNYVKNKHIITRELLNRLLMEWEFSMKKLNYEIPDNIEIIDG